LRAQPDDLDEQVAEVLAMVLAKVSGGAEIRLLIGGKAAEGIVAFEQVVDPPGTANALRVGVDENFEQHHWMILRPTAIFVGLRWIKRLEQVVIIEVVDGVRDEAFETVLFDPLGEVFREEMLLVLIVLDEVGSHR
jgi:hypothetical protein